MMARLFAAICLCVAAVAVVDGCGPGNKEDLEKLMNFLGITVDPAGLDGNAYDNDTELLAVPYVTAADELNCDFQNVSLCKWSNAPTDNISDHHDWYLFEKTVDKEWPLLNIRPGGQTTVGNRFILAGDKTAEESSAVWFSSPVKCQKEPGTLSFKYWVYNFAQIEVLLIEPGSYPLRVIERLPKKCTDFAADNSKCKVLIPAQDEPFQLAIRLYNLRNIFGALAMIDDIVYEADSLCKNAPVEKGLDLQKEELISGLTVQLIETDGDLLCSEFGGLCRWGSINKGNLDWVRASGNVSNSAWIELTGVFDPPKSPFALVESKAGDIDPVGILVSDPIPCQSDDGTITFRYWMTPGVILKVCALKELSLEPISCSTVEEFGSPGPRTVTVTGPIDQVFHLAFEASDFNRGKGGFAAVDDIAYSARLCTQTTRAPPTLPTRPRPPTTTTQATTTTTVSPTDLGELFTTQVFPDGLTEEFVDEAKNLDCSFESTGVLGVLCQWGSKTSAPDSVKWNLGLGPLNRNLLRLHTGSENLPRGEFAHIAFDGFGQGSLVSDPMRCMKGDGMLTFRYWASENVQLQACAVDNAGEPIKCQLVAEGQKTSGVARVPLPGPIKKRFTIRITALGTDPGFALVDEMHLDGDLCSATVPTTTPPTTTTTRPARHANSDACELLKCDFTAKSLCAYKVLMVEKSSARFNSRDAPIGVANNVRIGWSNNDYLGVTLFRRGPMAVLESQELQLNADGLLRFDYMRGTYGSHLHICRNRFDKTLTSCTVVAGPSLTRDEFDGGASAEIQLTAEDKKIYIVASHSRFNSGRASFAIDNLRLQDTDGATIC